MKLTGIAYILVEEEIKMSRSCNGIELMTGGLLENKMDAKEREMAVKDGSGLSGVTRLGNSRA